MSHYPHFGTMDKAGPSPSSMHPPRFLPVTALAKAVGSLNEHDSRHPLRRMCLAVRCESRLATLSLKVTENCVGPCESRSRHLGIEGEARSFQPPFDARP